MPPRSSSRRGYPAGLCFGDFSVKRRITPSVSEWGLRKPGLASSSLPDVFPGGGELMTAVPLGQKALQAPAPRVRTPVPGSASGLPAETWFLSQRPPHTRSCDPEPLRRGARRPAGREPGVRPEAHTPAGEAGRSRDADRPGPPTRPVRLGEASGPSFTGRGPVLLPVSARPVPHGTGAGLAASVAKPRSGLR